MAVGHFRGRTHPAETRLRILCIQSPRLSGRVHSDEGVMHDLGIAGMKFHAFDEARRSGGNWNHEVAVDIASFSRQGEWLGHGQDQVRLAQSPVAAPLRWRRQIGRRTFHRALGDPLLNQADFVHA